MHLNKHICTNVKFEFGMHTFIYTYIYYKDMHTELHAYMYVCICIYTVHTNNVTHIFKHIANYLQNN